MMIARQKARARMRRNARNLERMFVKWAAEEYDPYEAARVIARKHRGRWAKGRKA